MAKMPLESQIDKALRVLAAQTRPRVHIVRKPRPAGKGRAKLKSARGYTVDRSTDPYTNRTAYYVEAPNGETIGDFWLRRDAVAATRKHARTAGFSKLHPTLKGYTKRARRVAVTRARGGKARMGGVVVDTSKYVAAHRHEPRGYGLWVFDFDGVERLDAPGPYARAVGDARRYAASRNYSTITVLP